MLLRFFTQIVKYTHPRPRLLLMCCWQSGLLESFSLHYSSLIDWLIKFNFTAQRWVNNMMKRLPHSLSLSPSLFSVSHIPAAWARNALNNEKIKGENNTNNSKSRSSWEQVKVSWTQHGGNLICLQRVRPGSLPGRRGNQSLLIKVHIKAAATTERASETASSWLIKTYTPRILNKLANASSSFKLQTNGRRQLQLQLQLQLHIYR